MSRSRLLVARAVGLLAAGLLTPASAQVGRRFPSEKKVVSDPVTGVPLTFLTSTAAPAPQRRSR